MALPQWYVNLKDILADIWLNAGTKLIGWFITVVGLLAGLDISTVNEIAKFLGPTYGPYFGPACMVCAGLIVRSRGMKNTSDITDHIISRAMSGDPAANTAITRATASMPPNVALEKVSMPTIGAPPASVTVNVQSPSEKPV
jgi:hypothetical protein